MATDTTPQPTQEGSGQMFDLIAERYDTLNRLISLGIDRRWRAKAIKALTERGGARFLDVATGTADLAIAIASEVDGAEIDGVDPSVGMLEVGRQKVEAKAAVDRVRLHEGDAQALAFEDDTFDGAIIGFGIRNVPDRALGLREMARVTRPGAPVVILELAEPKSGVMGVAARFHMHQVVPRLGALLSGKDAYAYLPRSIAAFPEPADFAAMMEEAGLVDVRHEALTFGVATLYVGYVGT